MAEHYDIVIAGAGISAFRSELFRHRAVGTLCSWWRGTENPADDSGSRKGTVTPDRLGVHACLLGSRGATAKVLRCCQVSADILPVGMAI